MKNTQTGVFSIPKNPADFLTLDYCYDCASGRNRTYDPLLKRQVLYRLSYSRISLVYNLIIQQIAMESIIPRNCQMTISS